MDEEKENEVVSEEETHEEEIHEEVEEIEEDREDEEIKIDSNDDFSENKFGNDSNKELIKKLGFFMIIIVAVACVLGVFMWIMSLFKTTTYDYEDVEQIMKEAAQSYFSDHKKSLPKGKQIVEISDSVLVKNEYMDPLTEYLGEDSKCSGKVTVKKVDSKYIYTPYLNCGSDYSTTELYKVLKKKTVTSGAGLYRVNDNYIYRGEKLSNYVKINKHLWRIVKMNANNEIMLILSDNYMVGSSWDDRYNIDKDYNAGINDYRASRIKEYLNKVYKSNDEYYRLLTSNDRAKLTTFDVCVGKRAIGSNVKDNSEECSDIFSNQKMGILTVSDYLYASLDEHCNTTIDAACQNYNYLNNGDEWLTATAVNSNSYEIFFVDSNGQVDYDEAIKAVAFRPVIMLNNSVMIKSGKGTRKKPYKLK
ncbi:MAG: hypothetical protein IJF92_04065 [Bacilli bacterium]|nr:hypothetical protein [Bacilli bacterium]